MCACRRVVAQAALDARNARYRQRDPALRSMAEEDPAARDTSSAPSSEMEVWLSLWTAPENAWQKKFTCQQAAQSNPKLVLLLWSWGHITSGFLAVACAAGVF
jgi:hypothetical protein